MVLDLKNRIEKNSKRKTKKWRMHRKNGGGSTHGLNLVRFPFKLRENPFQLCVSVYRTEPSEKKSKKKSRKGGTHREEGRGGPTHNGRFSPVWALFACITESLG